MIELLFFRYVQNEQGDINEARESKIQNVESVSFSRVME